MIETQSRYACLLHSICGAIKSHDPVQWTQSKVTYSALGKIASNKSFAKEKYGIESRGGLSICDVKTLSTVLPVNYRKAFLELHAVTYLWCDGPLGSLAHSGRYAGGLDTRFCGECLFDGDAVPVRFENDHAEMLTRAVEQSVMQNMQPIRRRLQQIVAEIPRRIMEDASTDLSDWCVELSTDHVKDVGQPSLVFYCDVDNVRVTVSDRIARTFGISRRVCEIRASLKDHIVEAEETACGRKVRALYDRLAEYHLAPLA